jgi:hypothetical protein
MKVIATVQGTVGLFASHDDVAPPNGVAIGDLIRVIGDTYNFSVRPPPQHIPTPLSSQLVFQSGVLELGNEKLPIMQLATFSTGEMITAVNTEIAEKVLDHYVAALDRELGYKFASAPSHKVYQSNIVVEFDQGFEEQIAALGRIEALLSSEIKRDDPFKIKRLAFGFGRVAPPIMLQPSLQAMEKTDFVIERRDREPYEKNRYFCGAPTTTSELIRIVEMIEKELSK